MKLLLDTHAFLWMIAGDAALSTRARRAVEEARSESYLSAASTWEMAIKKSLRKLDLDVALDEMMRAAVEGGIRLLDIGVRHALAVEALPFHHRDPFDRLLIAQAMIEDLAIVSKDRHFDAYGIRRVW